MLMQMLILLGLLLGFSQWGKSTITTGKENIEQFIIPSNPFAILATIKNKRENPSGINFPQIYTCEIDNVTFDICPDVVSASDFNKQLNCWWIAIGKDN